MNTYTAIVSAAEDAWMVEVPEINRVTQALSLRHVDTMAKDLIHIMTDTQLEDIEIHIAWPEDIAAAIQSK